MLEVKKNFFVDTLEEMEHRLDLEKSMQQWSINFLTVLVDQVEEAHDKMTNE